MIDDKQLDHLFSDFHPDTTPDADFMRQLSRRMDDVDTVMAYKERELAACRRRAATCFVVGTIAGCISALVALLMPKTLDVVTLSAQWLTLSIDLSLVPLVVVAISLILLAYGIVMLIQSHQLRQQPAQP